PRPHPSPSASNPPAAQELLPFRASQKTPERPEGGAAVRDRVLLLLRHLSEGRAVRRIEEDGVVAEAGGAPGRGGDRPRALAAEEAERPRGTRDGGHGDVARAAALRRNVLELQEKAPAAGGVVRVLSAVARREGAGTAAQGLHLDPGVVADGDHLREGG